jgi:peptidyl-prolyl cis-trans isomerase A (cyclophilin A)
VLLLLATIAASAASQPATEPTTQPASQPARQPATTGDYYAIIHTSLGDVTVRLYQRQTPKTVANFVGLATGTRRWLHPETGATLKLPLYRNVLCHRVIADFMVQCGDPTGTGLGGPGYVVEDEILPSLHFDRPGVLAMANQGPNTAGSQFFITTKTQWRLDGQYTIFGHVVKNMAVVNQIASTKTDWQDRPVEKVIIRWIEIFRSAEPIQGD